MTDHEVSFNHIARTFRERGNRYEALRGMAYNHIMTNIMFARAEECMSEVARETDHWSRETCASISKFTDEQHDIRKVVEDLAQQVENVKHGTHPRSTSAGSSSAPEQARTEAGVPALLEIEGLKRKVARLTEQVTKNSQDISNLTPVLPRVDFMDNQIIRWRHRYPELTSDDGSDSEEEVPMLTAQAVYDHLGAFTQESPIDPRPHYM